MSVRAISARAQSRAFWMWFVGGIWAVSCSYEAELFDDSGVQVGAQTQAVGGEGPTSPTIVRGYLAVRVGARDAASGHFAPGTQDVYLPGISVTLRDLTTGSTVAAVSTDLSGRFSFPKQPKGRYQVCWSSRSLPAGCSPNPIAVGAGMVHVGTLRAQLPAANGFTAVWGQLTFGNGERPRFLEPIVNANAFARVTLLDARGRTLDRVSLNNFGAYLLPQVPVGQKLTLRATFEASTTDLAIAPGANLGGSPQHRIDLRFPNRPPLLAELAARNVSGMRVRIAQPGATVQLIAEATDDDGDPLSYRWALSPGDGTLSDTTSPAVDWLLPSKPGTYTVAVIAYDGRGGYAKSELSLTAHDKGVTFGGHIAGTDVPDLKHAEVTVNGMLTNTDAAGRFRLLVPEAERFVLAIHRRGYAMYSKIYDDGVSNGSWMLTRASTETVDPRLPIDVVNRRKATDCPRGFGQRFDWRKHPAFTQPQWQDGKNHPISPPKDADRVPLPWREIKRQAECGPGVRVQIPANGLVDAQGKPPAGLVDVESATVDLASPEQMPGDESVRMPDGSIEVAQSFGAGIWEFWAGDTRYNLAPGVEAVISIPVDPTQLASGAPLPAKLPLLYYDETQGVWYPDGELTLAGDVYQAKVKHFSAINADETKTDQACLDVHSSALPPTYSIELTIPQTGGAAPKVRQYVIDNAAPSRHVIYNLPANTNVVLVPYDTTSQEPFGVFVVNTGGSQFPTTPNLPANYDACSTDVTLTTLVLPDDPLSGEFLHGLFSFAATNLSELNPAVPAQEALRDAVDQATEDYYAQADPRAKRLTLAEFQATNGFPSGEVRAVYANSGDLGFGRDMRCVSNAGDVACMVTNFGNNTTDDQTDADDALDGLAPVATVAMEYSRIEDPPGSPSEFSDPEQVVKFFVYDGSGNRINAANLDGKGLRPIPQLCMVCHGGEYPGGVTTGVPSFSSRDDVKLGSVFLPFDLAYFKYPTEPGWDKASQQAAFRSLNEDFVLATNPTPAIQTVIAQMYAGGPSQDENLVVPAWNASPADVTMYRSVVAHTCRTCHASLPAASLRFETAAQFKDRLGAVEARVCSEHVMPHSLVTHNLFWQSIAPNMAAQLQVFGDANKTGANGWVGNKCGSFTAGGSTPASVFLSTIQAPIFDVNCVGCHIGGSPPASLNLSGNAYSAIVNVASSELPSMLRIRPSDIANSYLLRKVKGQQGMVGGSGSQMPPGGPLPAATLTALDSWVNAGAPP